MTDVLKMGIVGTGMIANIVADAASQTPAVELTAVASRNIKTAVEFANRHGNAQPFGSWRELIGSKAIDAVYVAVPTAVEEEICISAAENKKHLLADKPFANLASLQRIINACRKNGVAFLDATHFVHHPRTALIREFGANEIGKIRALRTSFYAPVEDRTNIRFHPEFEPTGALGDLAWYSMRAIVEFLPIDLSLESVMATAYRDADTNAVIRAAGLFQFEHGITSTWEVGYDVGAGVMDLELLGSEGMIRVDDFVLDWRNGLPNGDPDFEVGFSLRRGMTTPNEFQFVAVRSDKSSKVLMLEKLALLAARGIRNGFNEAEMHASERTQRLLDTVSSELVKYG